MSLRLMQVMVEFKEAQARLKNATTPAEKYNYQGQVDKYIRAAHNCHRDIKWIEGPASERDPLSCGRMGVVNGEDILSFVHVSHVHNQDDKDKRARAKADKANSGRIRGTDRDRMEALPAVCTECKACASFVTDNRTATRTCTVCGAVNKWQCPMVESLDLLWSENSIPKPPGYSYKQSNHMWSWILRIQGKEAVDIPDGLLDRLSQEFAKTGVTKENVTPAKIRQGLKNLKAPKFYNHIHTMQHMIFGVLPPQMEEEQERAIMEVFGDIITVYNNLKKTNNVQRVNMLSYSYVLRKIMEMLGYDEFIDQLVLLKHRDRLQEQERIWKLMCEEVPDFHFTYTA